MAQVKTFSVEAGWRTLLKDLGVKPADVLRRAGLPEDLLTRPQASLSTTEYFLFWRSLEAALGDPRFPLRLVEAITPEVFSPPIFAALCSPNLHLATQRLARYKKLVAPMALEVSVDKRGVLSIGPRWLDARVVPPLTVVASELAFFLRLARLATREPIRAVRVTMPTIPDSRSAYEEYFGTSIRKGKAASISFSASDATLPFLTANPTIWQVFEPDLRRRLAEIDETAPTCERVRDLLLESLPSGQTSMEAMAGRLAMSKRTLQRRLGESGVTFQTLVNQTREELARHYLSQTTLSIAEISFLLGYGDPNSFFRAFHDWTGQTPEGLRKGAAPALSNIVTPAASNGSA
jgi:AraC-like DNA-binding protein